MKKVLIVIIFVVILMLFNACSSVVTTDTNLEEQACATTVLADNKKNTAKETDTQYPEYEIEPFFSFANSDDDDYTSKRIMKKSILDPQSLFEAVDRTNEYNVNAHAEAAVCLVRPTDVDTKAVILKDETYLPLYTFEIVNVFSASSDADQFTCLKKGNVIKATDPNVKFESGVLRNGEYGNIPVIKKNALYLIAFSYQEEYYEKLDISVLCPFKVILHQVYTPDLAKEIISQSELDGIFENTSMKVDQKEKYKEYIYKYAEGLISDQNI